jgi:hypothetical protein
MPAPSNFSGQAGTTRSVPEGMVAGYGSAAVRSSKSFSATMTAIGITPTYSHTYIFTIVSIAFYRAVNRAKNFVSTFRTQM